jgi:hypothetical protein
MFEKATRGLLRCGLAATMVLGAGGIARADVITLTSGNSSALITTGPGSSGSAGMQDWTVDGVDKLFLQWFGFSYQNDNWLFPNGQTIRGALDALGTPVTSHTADTASLSYNNGSIAVSVAYTLTGDAPDSQKSKIDEVITITNLMSRDLMKDLVTGVDNTLHFFQYSDFDLCGVGSHDSVSIGYSGASQSSFCDGVVSETLINPSAGNQYWPGNTGAGFQAGEPNDVGLNAFHGIDLPNTNTTDGLHDAAWAFEWNIPFTANGGGFDTFTIHKTKSLAPVPEAMSLVLLGAGLVGVGQMIRRRRAETVVA